MREASRKIEIGSEHSTRSLRMLTNLDLQQQVDISSPCIRASTRSMSWTMSVKEDLSVDGQYHLRYLTFRWGTSLAKTQTGLRILVKFSQPRLFIFLALFDIAASTHLT
jgi:hypothetical protein